MPDIYALAQKFRAELNRGEGEAFARMTEAYSAALDRLRPQIEQLTGEIGEARARGEEVTPGWLFRLERLDRLQAQIEIEMRRFATDAAQITAERQRRLSTDAAGHSAEMIRAAVGDRTLEVRSAVGTRLDRGAVQAFVGFASDGSPLSDLFGALGPLAARRARDTMIEGITLGYGTDKLARALRDDLNGNMVRALAIARTESLRSYRDATLENYAENDDVVGGWIWHCSRSPRTCAVCWAMDGAEFGTDEPMASHVNCRCVMLPKVRGARRPERGEAAFARLTVEQQRAILGRSKHAAYADGRIALQNLVGVRRDARWGVGRYERSLKDALGGTARGALTASNRYKSERQKPTPKAQEVAPNPSAFPAGVEHLEQIKVLGGSTGAMLVRDPATGKQFVMKRGANEGHLREEFAADEAYRALGVPVPASRLYETKQGPVKLAEFIEGRTLGALTGTEREAAEARLRQHFAADALLGNWDVVGAAYDNILVGKDGTPYRIDNGGSLRYRAQGAKKSSFDEHVGDLWTLRDKTVNRQTAEVFGKLSIYDLEEQIALLASAKGLDAALPKDLRPTIAARVKTLEEIAGFSRDLRADKWKAGYADEVTRHINGIRQAGVTKRLPKRLDRVAGGTNVKDEKGKLFDHLRGKGSVLADVRRYMAGQGADLGIVKYWKSGQASHSWNDGPKAFKFFIASQRTDDPEDYFWGTPDNKKALAECRTIYEAAAAKVGAEKYLKSHAAYKALMMEFLSRVDFENNDRGSRAVRLIRTENKQVLVANKIKKGARGARLKRGAAESFSIFKKVVVHGGEVTHQTLPHTRIHGIYFFGRDEGYDGGSFLGDSENEFNALPVGVPFDYE